MNLHEKININVHTDRIWTSGCQEKENAISRTLNKHRIPHRLVDVPDWYVDKQPQPKNFVTDCILHNATRSYIWVPSIWHIFLFNNPITYEVTPTVKANALFNRASGDRQRLLYRIHQLNMENDCILSYNAQGLERLHGTESSIEQRQCNFKNTHHQTGGFPELESIYSSLVDKIPLTTDHTPESAAMNSLWTIISETYTSNDVTVFSEKMFRALQTPRPWVLWSSMGAVKVLEDAGFDVMSDIVNHNAYDCIENDNDRQIMMLKTLNRTDVNYNESKDRFYIAADRNRRLLQKFKQDWNNQFSKLLQSTSSRSQS